MKRAITRNKNETKSEYIEKTAAIADRFGSVRRNIKYAVQATNRDDMESALLLLGIADRNIKALLILLEDRQSATTRLKDQMGFDKLLANPESRKVLEEALAKSLNDSDG